MRNYNTHHAPKSHLTLDHRRIIEQAYTANLRRPKKGRLSMTALARALGLPRSTLGREVKLGLVSRPNTWKERDIWDYSARKAQDEHTRRQAQKGCPMRMNPLIAQLLRQFILSLGLSPYDALCRIRETVKDLAWLPSLSTVYNHIWHGDIGILYGQTPCHPRKHRRPAGSTALQCFLQESA